MEDEDVSASPKSGSKASGDIGKSSVRAEPPSRSPSISDDSLKNPLKSSKRRFPGDSYSLDHPTKVPAVERIHPSAAANPRNAPTGILPEDVGAQSFRRSPPSASTGPSRNSPGSRKFFGSGQTQPKSPQTSSNVDTKALDANGGTSSRPNSRPTPTLPGSAPSNSSRGPSSSSSRHPGVYRPRHNPQWPTLVLQPESREISQEQLAAEVKSIYTGLTMVETKCIHIDKAQSATPRSESKITDDHWQAMIALHRTLLHEHHDFFLASQHPSASPALKRLALKYSMPARMWKHGIHSFLELLRHRLPESLEYMLAFIYLAYQMMALLYETVGTFRNTWIECLGDLGRYRMAVEDEDVRDREIWAGVARSWYNKAADTNPAIGRLFHHLAILARPNMIQQLYLYNRSLTSVMPFMNARESIVTIFDPILSQSPPLHVSVSDTALIRAHALLFKRKNLDAVPVAIESYVNGLAAAIAQAGDKWREVSAFTAIANIGALYDFGSESNPIRFIFEVRRKMIQQRDPKCMPPGLPEDQSVPDIGSIPQLDDTSPRAFEYAVDLLLSTFKVCLSRPYDSNVLPHVHCTCLFLLHLSEFYGSLQNVPHVPYGGHLLLHVPWSELVSFANTLAKGQENINEKYKKMIIFEEGGRPLPEDWMMRGLSWSFEYFPRLWFKNAAVTEEEERYMERTSTMKGRIDRFMSLMVQLAKTSDKIVFNPDINRFNVVGQDVEMLDDDEGYKSEDSPQMEAIQREHRQKPVTGDCAKNLRTKYGTIVPNLDILKQTDLLNIILDSSNMAMVIPHECMATLLDSANAHDVSSNEAASALHNIRNALNEYRDITIQDANDNDLTRFYIGSLATFFEEQPRQQGRTNHPITTLQKQDSVIDTLHAVARQNSDPTKKMSRAPTGISSRTTTGLTQSTLPTDYSDDEDMEIEGFPSVSEPLDGRPALVITDDRKVRAQVGKLGTAAIAGWMIKKWLTQAKKTKEGQTTPKPMDVDHPMEAPAAA